MKSIIKPWAVKHSIVSSEREIEFKNVENDKKKDDEYIMKENDTAKHENIASTIDNLAPICKWNEHTSNKIMNNRKIKEDKLIIINHDNLENFRGNSKHRSQKYHHEHSHTDI